MQALKLLQPFGCDWNKAVEIAIAQHLEAVGATNWTTGQFEALAATIGCTRRQLAVMCGEKVNGKGVLWRRKVPRCAGITLAVIKQFVEFKITGVLGPPIIPLDALLKNHRVRLIRKGRRQDKRRYRRTAIPRMGSKVRRKRKAEMEQKSQVAAVSEGVLRETQDAHRILTG